MNRADESWQVLLDGNDQLHGRLLTWEMLLTHFAADDCHADGRSVQVLEILQSFTQTLEQEMARVCIRQERGPYADAAESSPRLRSHIWALHEDHVALRERFAQLRQRLGERPFLEQPEQVLAAGLEFSKELREHMQKDERMAAVLMEMGCRMRTSGSGAVEAASST